jgi:hypothetical protein
MVKLYKRTIALLERIAAHDISNEPIASEREEIQEARDILKAIEEAS